MPLDEENQNKMFPVSATDYKNGLDMLTGYARAISLMPLEDMMTQVDSSETLAPFLDPTKWMRGGANNLDDQKELIRAFIPVKQAVEKIRERHLARIARGGQ